VEFVQEVAIFVTCGCIESLKNMQFYKFPFCCKLSWNWIKSTTWVFQIKRCTNCSAILWHPLGLYDLIAGHMDLQFSFSILYFSHRCKSYSKIIYFTEGKIHSSYLEPILLEFSNDIICDCPLQNKRFRHVCFKHLWLEKVLKMYYFVVVPSVVERNYWQPCMIQRSLPKVKMDGSGRHHRLTLL
jgi:hypothetical protein